MNMMNYIIIEDELFGARMLAEAIGRLSPSYRLLCILGTVRESVDYFRRHPDDDSLVFMDVELSDGQCFEIFNQCRVGNPIIFTTSHDEWAIRAFRVNSIDYLLKPIEDGDLLRAVEKHEYQVGVAEANVRRYVSLLAAVGGRRTSQNRLLVSCGNRYVAVEVEEMALFDADDKYVTLHTFSGQEYLVDYKLKELVELLPPELFHRVSRSCIVNRNVIREVRKFDQGRLKIRFRSPCQEREELVSASQRDSFLEWFGR